MLKKYTTEPLQEYTTNGTRFFVIIMPLYVVVLNVILFGTHFFSSVTFALTALLVTFFFMALVWAVHTWASLLLKDKLPEEKYYFKQLAIKLSLFICFKSLMLTLMFATFLKMGFISGEAKMQKLIWLLIIGNVFNVSVTLLHDGSRGFDRWKATLIETEQLRKTYMVSQLMNLKSQVSPNFLFKNLNLLSTLMHESPKQAEYYLDEMSKVYQYFLKTGEESLVALQCEISFLHSYFHLIKQQNNKVELSILVEKNVSTLLLPPFTLQALVEQSIKRKEQLGAESLHCTVSLTQDKELAFKSNFINPTSTYQKQESLLLFDNIIRKFSLLTQQTVAVEETIDYQLILLPLIPKSECSAK
jgi:sensor histidine kinase YesM